MEDTRSSTKRQATSSNLLDQLPEELQNVITRKFSTPSVRRKISSVSHQNSIDHLNEIHHQFYSYLQHHENQFWAALVYSHGQLKQDDLVTDQFLSTVALGSCLDKPYLIALARHHVHPVHVVHYLLTRSIESPGQSNPDKTFACQVADVVCRNYVDFQCAVWCMNSQAQEKIQVCQEYQTATGNATMHNFVALCYYHMEVYRARPVHHIEHGDVYTAIWCYNSQHVWYATRLLGPRSSETQLTPLAPLQMQLGANHIVSIQRYTKNLFYSDPSHKLNFTNVELGGETNELAAKEEKTVKAILTQEEDVLVQLLRSGNIAYVSTSLPAIMGHAFGPYVDIILAGKSQSIVHYFALSSKGKVYRVFFNINDGTCDFVEIRLQNDTPVPVVQIVCIQGTKETPFYLVTRNAENTFCMCTFTDGTGTRVQFERHTREFRTVVEMCTQNIILIPKTMQMLADVEAMVLEDDENEQQTLMEFTKGVVTIVSKPDTGESQFRLFTQRFERTARNVYEITARNTIDLTLERPARGFDIRNIVEIVQMRETFLFCLMANGHVYLCTINFEENTYSVYYVPLTSPSIFNPSMDGSGSVTASASASTFRLRLRLSK